jgi:N6-adenosine-specific RNA methylase IME4
VKFSTIVADPPWKVKRGTLMGREGWLDAHGAARDCAYPTMTVAEIAALPVREIAEPDAHLYLWAVNKYLGAAFEVAKAWGFKYSTTLVWDKTMFGGGLGGGFRVNTEYVLFCRRGQLGNIGTVRGTSFHYKRPYDSRGKPRQGAKPPQFLADYVEVVSPGPYVELFSRAEESRENWWYWGNESLETAEIL